VNSKTRGILLTTAEIKKAVLLGTAFKEEGLI
jgi:hypothetical protein